MFLAFVVVSNAEKNPVLVPKTQASQLPPQNPVFVPITMASNISILTNQSSNVVGTQKYVQVPQTAMLKIQQQVGFFNFHGQSLDNS